MLEPVIAAQDFEVFVPMMMRKNVELQLQALQMIEVLIDMMLLIIIWCLVYVWSVTISSNAR
jgi:hypothetical protein